ncbi:MAG: hypothetical protein RL657_826 [Pseudomonadota bacterium]|jgi:tetraacyldisaccharide 4'-kinase
MSVFWAKVWSRRQGWALTFWPISWVYGCLWRIRAKLYHWGVWRTHRLPVPVLVVGNVFIGGTGKTPITIELVRRLRDLGWQPGVVSRGHGRKHLSPQEVRSDSSADQVGDEPLLIHRQTGVPLVVANDRALAGRVLIGLHPEVNLIVCDDGLQHLALERDVELCVFDARFLGNGWLLPAGPLREPWPRFSKPGVQSHALSSQPCPLPGAWSVRRTLAHLAINGHGDTMVWSDCRQPVRALAAIAQPQAFFNLLIEAGVPLHDPLSWPDHDPLLAWNPRPGETWFCTEKDAVKIWPRHPQVWAIPLNVVIEPALITQIDQELRAKLSSPHGH